MWASTDWFRFSNFASFVESLCFGEGKNESQNLLLAYKNTKSLPHSLRWLYSCPELFLYIQVFFFCPILFCRFFANPASETSQFFPQRKISHFRRRIKRNQSFNVIVKMFFFLFSKHPDIQISQRVVSRGEAKIQNSKTWRHVIFRFVIALNCLKKLYSKIICKLFQMFSFSFFLFPFHFSVWSS